MACSTCHLIIDPADFAKLPDPVEMEEDMLDLAVAVTRTSRLSCQIFLREEWGSLTCRVPAESYDMQGRSVGTGALRGLCTHPYVRAGRAAPTLSRRA